MAKAQTISDRRAALAEDSTVTRVRTPGPDDLTALKARLLLRLSDLGDARHAIDSEIRELLLLDPDLADWLDKHPAALVD